MDKVQSGASREHEVEEGHYPFRDFEPKWRDRWEKAGLFQKRVFYVFDHYDELWGSWLKKFKALGEEMASIKVPAAVALPKGH